MTGTHEDDFPESMTYSKNNASSSWSSKIQDKVKSGLEDRWEKEVQLSDIAFCDE